MGEPPQQIPAPKHAGNAPGHEQGEQKLGRGKPKKPEVLLGGAMAAAPGARGAFAAASALRQTRNAAMIS